MNFERIYSNLDIYLEKNKVLLMYGPRRVGKTTLVKDFLEKTAYKYKLDSGENIKTREVLSSEDFDKIKEYCEGYDLIVLDEAQKIPNVGLALKIIVDQIPDIRVIATGSSSFELAGQVGEPLVGRKKTLRMFPLSILELQDAYSSYELSQRLPEFLVYGMYPDILTTQSKTAKANKLDEIINAYLFKDILELERIKGSKVLLDLLRLIAYQVGSEVSLPEIGAKLALDYKTVGRYLDLFEKSFIIFNLRGYSRNLREEVTKKSKYYFYDNGVLNAVIANFNALEIRNDIGTLWENFLVTERLKKLTYTQTHANTFFWRTWSQKEVDWVEEREGKLYGYEFKYTNGKSKHAAAFISTYPDASVEVINKDNYLSFVK